MERLSLETQTLYAELQDQLTVLEAQRSVGSIPGGFTTKNVKGETYYYFQHSSPGSQRQQVYVGKESPALKRLVEQYQEENWKGVRNRFSQNETASLKQPERLENKKGGRGKFAPPNIRLPLRGRSLTH